MLAAQPCRCFKRTTWRTHTGRNELGRIPSNEFEEVFRPLQVLFSSEPPRSNQPCDQEEKTSNARVHPGCDRVESSGTFTTGQLGTLVSTNLQPPFPEKAETYGEHPTGQRPKHSTQKRRLTETAANDAGKASGGNMSGEVSVFKRTRFREPFDVLRRTYSPRSSRRLCRISTQKQLFLRFCHPHWCLLATLRCS